MQSTLIPTEPYRTFSVFKANSSFLAMKKIDKQTLIKDNKSGKNLALSIV